MSAAAVVTRATQVSSYPKDTPSCVDPKRRRALATLSFSDANKTYKVTRRTVSCNPDVESPQKRVKASSPPSADEQGGLLCEVNSGLELGNHPTLTDAGTGGSYFLRGKEGRNIAIWKPAQEEPYGPRNPRGFVTNDSSRDTLGCASPMRPGFRVGEGFMRERAAFLLDEVSGVFSAGIPNTIVAEEIEQPGYDSLPQIVAVSPSAYHTKRVEGCAIGSLQAFVANDGDCEDFGSGVLHTTDVHCLAVLDMRILNADRHGSNILVVGESGKNSRKKHIVPIDHGFAFPKYTSLGGTYFVWAHWPQAREAFSPAMKEFVINRIHIDRDADILRAQGIGEECILSMRLGSYLLREATRYEIPLADIARLYMRTDPCGQHDDEEHGHPSWIELAVASSRKKAGVNRLSDAMPTIRACKFGRNCPDPKQCGCTYCNVFASFCEVTDDFLSSLK